MGAVHPYRSPYAAKGECIVIYEQDSIASFDEMRSVVECFAEMVPADFCKWPAVRVKFRFGSFSISCLEHRDALLALADRFRKPINYNISGFHFPSKRGGHSKANATRIDEHLLAFEL